jgi:hypothetical protein
MEYAAQNPNSAFKKEIQMSAKIAVSMSFEVEEGNSAEISALLAKLFGSFDPGTSAVAKAIEPEVKVLKVRKIRVMTDEQKAAFRARMIAGREAKAKTNGSVSKPEPVIVIAPAKPVSAPKTATTKPGITVSVGHTTKVPVIPIPRTGYKVEAKPASK